MKKVFIIYLLASLTAVGLFSCTTVECGEGTVNQNGECVSLNLPDNNLDDPCSPVGIWDPVLEKCIVDAEDVCQSGTEVVWEEDGSFHCEGTGTTGPECPDAEPGGPICISGSITNLIDPADNSRFLSTQVTDPERLGNLEVVIYDPLAFAMQGAGANPLGIATVDATSGLFMVEGITVPSMEIVAIVVRDAGWTPDATELLYIPTGFAYLATAGTNLEGVFGVVVEKEQMDSWQGQLPAGWLDTACDEADMYLCGAWLAYFNELETVAPVNGVIPSSAGNPLPEESVFYLDADAEGNINTVTTASDRHYTSSTGLATYLGASFASYYGVCDTENLDPQDSLCVQWDMEYDTTQVGGSAPYTLFVQFVRGVRNAQ